MLTIEILATFFILHTTYKLHFFFFEKFREALVFKNSCTIKCPKMKKG